MQVSQNVLQKRYTDSVHNQQGIDIHHGSRNRYIPISADENYLPQDVFVKSEYLQKIEGLGDSIQGGFKDASSFMAMANVLRGENILNSQDLIAAGYIAKTSEDINFEAFNKLLRNEQLSMEMKGLISQLVNKLYNINYVHAGIMMAS
ncbi:MAG: hypothetical protein SPJ83_04550 [Helicobacter sp.]|uniref:Uncharacterized protein n=2 Tax=Helicobacter bilis TaxID=37372 RepID=C3XH27_9HELI|nr:MULTISPECIES: hypothetical protein [Helicobacter]AQQ59772.1 hypothetical protein XJ32_06355 [Helicobacter bilis]EEO24316.1 hypothetical protein HRAG_01373 [Helicobacter bilis ATCC 43879]MCI7410188.1 hypothetical protein [Helicobacter bilis]MDD7296909.1 hypothetical protein [Helicobacter bilis]MDY4400224.1 hypothetical protein [Helicobacter bilis]